MRITQYETAYQLTYYRNDSLHVNCYLVEEKDGVTLIDTGIHESFTEIVHAVANLGKRIHRILLTHAHHDHIGALDALTELFPNVLVYISAREARLLTGDRSLDIGEPDTPIRGNIPTTIKTRPNALLREGDRIGSLLALATPGHTPGSMSFFDTRNRFLFAGDAFQTAGGIAVAGQHCPLFPYPALGTWSRHISLQSARKLLTSEPALLAVGHGELVKYPYTDMLHAISQAEFNCKNEI